MLSKQRRAKNPWLHKTIHRNTQALRWPVLHGSQNNHTCCFNYWLINLLWLYIIVWSRWEFEVKHNLKHKKKNPGTVLFASCLCNLFIWTDLLHSSNVPTMHLSLQYTSSYLLYNSAQGKTNFSTRFHHKYKSWIKINLCHQQTNAQDDILNIFENDLSHSCLGYTV